MSHKFPPDRFDAIPSDIQRVGAHRAPPKPGHRWVWFAWMAGATIAIIIIGAVGIYVLKDRLDFSGAPGAAPQTSAPSETPIAAVPTIDPSLSVTVLNGTTIAGLAATAGDQLTAQGWLVGATSNASTEDITQTTVYYADAALEGAALGLANSLEGAQISFSSDFAGSGAQLTVVLGTDYTPPDAG